MTYCDPLLFSNKIGLLRVCESTVFVASSGFYTFDYGSRELFSGHFILDFLEAFMVLFLLKSPLILLMRPFFYYAVGLEINFKLSLSFKLFLDTEWFIMSELLLLVFLPPST